MTDDRDDASDQNLGDRDDASTRVEANREEMMQEALQHGVDQAIMATRQDQDQAILAELDTDGLGIKPPQIHLHNWAPIIGTHTKIGDGWYCTVRCDCGTEIVEVADDIHRG
jgi:hypothetical protein